MGPLRVRAHACAACMRMHLHACARLHGARMPPAASRTRLMLTPPLTPILNRQGQQAVGQPACEHPSLVQPLASHEDLPGGQQPQRQDLAAVERSQPGDLLGKVSGWLRRGQRHRVVSATAVLNWQLHGSAPVAHALAYAAAARTRPCTRAHLTALKHANVNKNPNPPSSRRNQLTGSLPPEFGATWKATTELDVARNSLSGPLPSEWAGMSKLERLDLGYNEIRGQLPAAWSKVLPQMKSIFLTKNKIHGSIPGARARACFCWRQVSC